MKRLGLVEAESLLVEPALHQLKPYYPSKTLIVRGRVGLFTGCIAEHFDLDTLKTAVKLLTTIGFDVFIPTEQSCCGAIQQHNGQSAERLISNNLKVFNSLKLDAVIYTATGCGAMLNEYKHSDNQAAESFTQRLFDLNDFLLRQWPEDLKLNSAILRIAVHEPCSQRNVLKNQQAIYKLLEKIPGLSISSLPDNHLCCGAGGSYMLTHPENAAALRQKKIQLIDDSNADLVASSNFGCALFLNKVNNKVIHPVRLLARQLPSKS